MKSKPREFLLGLGCILFSLAVGAEETSGAWSDSPVGRCFNSVQDFMAQRYGSEYASDENIKTSRLGSINSKDDGRSQNVEFFWVMDITPGTNITRTLMISRSSGQACAILYAPLSSEISLQDLKAGKLPSKIITNDTPPPGLDGHRIVYRLDGKSKTYSPRECYRVKPSKKVVKDSCAHAFKE